MSDSFKISPLWTYAAAGIVVGTIAGFVLGRTTAAPPYPLQLRRPITMVDQESEEEESDQEDVQSFENNREECKLVLVVRTDLGMTKGKIAAQCSHATLACYKALLHQQGTKPGSILSRWESLGQAKVTVQVKSEDELLELQAKAMSLGLCAKIIHDAGRTQIASGSATVLGIGPGPRSIVDQVSGGLKLL